MRHLRVFLIALVLVVSSVGLSGAAPVTISNATTSIQVNGGEANNGLVPFDGYFRYTDIGEGEETTWSIDPFLRFDDGSTLILSNGSAGGFGGAVADLLDQLPDAVAQWLNRLVVFTFAGPASSANVRPRLLFVR